MITADSKMRGIKRMREIMSAGVKYGLGPYLNLSAVRRYGFLFGRAKDEVRVGDGELAATISEVRPSVEYEVPAPVTQSSTSRERQPPIIAGPTRWIIRILGLAHRKAGEYEGCSLASLLPQKSWPARNRCASSSP